MPDVLIQKNYGNRLGRSNIVPRRKVRLFLVAENLPESRGW